jgi:hypothetical protein
MVKYTLVNPAIEGTLETTHDAKNSIDAANFFYNEMSQYFNNHVPNFMFSFQKGGASNSNAKLYHYKVTERREGNEVSFKLREHVIEDEEAVRGFRTRLESHRSRQAGGKKRSKKHSKKHDMDSSDSDDSNSNSSSDSSSDDYIFGSSNNNYSKSLYYWWYDPYVYKMDSLFIPTFYSYVTPYVELAVLPTVAYLP